MVDKTFNQFSEQFTKSFEPARRFAALTLDHMETVSRFQFEAAQAYIDLGVQQSREALRISDAKSFQEYVAKQRDVAETVSKKINEDAQKLADYGKAYTEEATKLAGENVSDIQAAATPKQKKSA